MQILLLLAASLALARAQDWSQTFDTQGDDANSEGARAAAGDGEAQFQLGQKARGRMEYLEAFSWYEKAAKQVKC
jgi:TPR repeat protein